MTTSVSAGTPAQPITAPPAGVQPDALPVVAGGGSQVVGAVPMGDTAAAGSLVDQALAQVLGGVSGGGADAPISDPADGIPDFVQRFLPASTGSAMPPAVEGAWQQAPGKGPHQVRQGWALIGCAPHAPQAPPRPPQYPPHVPPYPVDQLPPSGPPSKGDVPPSGPPSKGTPQGKVDGPQQVGQAGDRGTHVVGAGEYLSLIAPKYGLTWQQLYWANKDQIGHPDLIHPGQELRIPSCDLEVPDFPYTPMFTGPAGPSKPGRRVPRQGPPPSKPGTPPGTPSSPPPGKHDAPGKPDVSPPTGKPDAPGKPDASPPPAKPDAPGTPDMPPPTAKPEEPAPSGPPPIGQGPGDAPPGSPKPDGSLPPAPPAPGGSELPPALPG